MSAAVRKGSHGTDGAKEGASSGASADMSLPEHVESMKLSELRAWLDERNKPSYGKKEDLLERMKRLAAGESVADKRAYNRFQPSAQERSALGVESWKLSELRNYLEQRNKPSYGKKEDLVKRINKINAGEAVADKRAYKRKKKRARDNMNDMLYLYPQLTGAVNPLMASNMAMALMQNAQMAAQAGEQPKKRGRKKGAMPAGPNMSPMLGVIAQQMMQTQLQSLIQQQIANNAASQGAGAAQAAPAAEAPAEDANANAPTAES